ncbi:hypothetical protein NEF87_004775 [Candidatus Lokiarchaeum ossiferum]|uniref:Uncharacterized protein n=1 Tax=Candidatus Lokiarchaeum ossiferum TaxID=2951803 RepID=A0ABY6HY77_9ARCH|nr:hypothetical protein NEF87_004775 [Candidatus Lokiarchaeum sp. B-35]
MPNIEIDFNKYIPSGAVFYEYYTILKSHNFVPEESHEISPQVKLESLKQRQEYA